MARVAVTLKSTDQLLRSTAGNSDPSFDGGIEDLHTLTSAVHLVDGVAKKHHTVDGGVVVEMDQAGKDAVDAADAPGIMAIAQAGIKAALYADYLDGFAVDVTASGLVITTDIDKLVADDQTVVVADATNTKYVKLWYVYNEDTDSFYVLATEKTTGNYAPINWPEYVLSELKVFTVVANGTDLVEV